MLSAHNQGGQHFAIVTLLQWEVVEVLAQCLLARRSTPLAQVITGQKATVEAIVGFAPF